ncbi:MAG: hypothetical protein ACI90V_000231 [Bacillariaceae sp.]|jgi:hypothetical protein
MDENLSTLEHGETTDFLTEWRSSYFFGMNFGSPSLVEKSMTRSDVVWMVFYLHYIPLKKKLVFNIL